MSDVPAARPYRASVDISVFRDDQLIDIVEIRLAAEDLVTVVSRGVPNTGRATPPGPEGHGWQPVQHYICCDDDMTLCGEYVDDPDQVTDVTDMGAHVCVVCVDFRDHETPCDNDNCPALLPRPCGCWWCRLGRLIGACRG